MVFKNNNIVKPTIEQLSICEVSETGDIYTIAYDTENTANCITYSVQNQIECIIFNRDEKRYCYVFKDSIEKANALFNTNYTEEGWYLVDFAANSVQAFNGELEITYAKMLDYAVLSPTYFSLLMKNYVPLKNGNAVKLLTKNKCCKEDISVLPVLQKKLVTENGIYYADSGYCGLERISVQVPERIPILKDIRIIENGEYVVEEGYDGFNKVNVKIVTGGVIDLANVPEVESIENPTENSSVMVKCDGQYYLLLKEN